MGTGIGSYRPPIMGVTHMVSSGHYLAAAAGYRILEEGGNAVDAGVASGIAVNVTTPENTNFAGVAPIIIYLAEEDRVVTISGLGRWPKKASIDYFLKHCDGDLPQGILRAVVPAAPDAWLTALERYGTMTFEQVITPSIELTEGGYPVTAVVQAELLEDSESEYGTVARWSSTRDVFMPGGRVPDVGQVLHQRDLASTFRRLVEVEQANAGKGRAAAIRAARDYFYKGDIAQEMAEFSREQDGLIQLEDIQDFSVKIEEPVRGRFRDYDIYTCGPWCQGPVVAQVLQMLEDDDMNALGHNSPEYIHLVSQAFDLAFSDREHYYGDPDFVDVPMEQMMAKQYTSARREVLDMNRAYSELPPPGDPRSGLAVLEGAKRPAPSSASADPQHDTSYTCAVDRWGNAFSATPSDSNTNGPLVPGLGFSLSSRGTQSWLDSGHASSLQPWKRPRLTPNPAIAFKDGKLFMPFGCPGGDAQCQAMVQLFLNVVEFGMNPQKALEEPRFTTWNFPDSFWPHTYQKGRLNLEGRMPQTTADELVRLGRDVRVVDDWEPMSMGVPAAIMVDPETGVLSGGADPRRDTYAIGR